VSESLSVEGIRWRGLPAWRIRGRGLTAVLTVIGGQLASLTSRDDDLNPLWQPVWPAARAGAGDPAVFGNQEEASLLPVIVGSFPCIDRFGAPHPGEDSPGHGEAKEVDYTVVGGDPTVFAAKARCPRRRLWVERRIRMDGRRLSLATTVTHDADDEREVEWCEHLTLGDPFLDGVEITAAATDAWAHVERPATPLRFPADAPLAHRAADQVLAMPAADSPPVGDIYTVGADAGWLEAVNRRLGRRLRVAWEVTEFPWLCCWTEHRARQHRPWNGISRARGLELSTKPFPEGRPAPDRHPVFAGRSACCRVPPGTAGLTKTIVLEWGAAD
jgi:hypothetical protein